MEAAGIVIGLAGMVGMIITCCLFAFHAKSESTRTRLLMESMMVGLKSSDGVQAADGMSYLNQVRNILDDPTPEPEPKPAVDTPAEVETNAGTYEFLGAGPPDYEFLGEEDAQ